MSVSKVKELNMEKIGLNMDITLAAPFLARIFRVYMAFFQSQLGIEIHGYQEYSPRVFYPFTPLGNRFQERGGLEIGQGPRWVRGRDGCKVSVGLDWRPSNMFNSEFKGLEEARKRKKMGLNVHVLLASPALRESVFVSSTTHGLFPVTAWCQNPRISTIFPPGILSSYTTGELMQGGRNWDQLRWVRGRGGGKVSGIGLEDDNSQRVQRGG